MLYAIFFIHSIFFKPRHYGPPVCLQGAHLSVHCEPTYLPTGRPLVCVLAYWPSYLSTELSTGLPTGRLLVRLEKKKKKKKIKNFFSNKLSSERALIGYTHHINF
jgi:hypothetical protein